jgi:hypothetical protein
VGGSGDDLYNVPGAIKLDASQDTGNQTRIDVGDASGFDATPTIAQLNASSGLNQVIGALNRRILNYNATFGTTATTLSYLSADAKITASNFTAINNKINTLRTTEGFATYTFSSPSTNTSIKGIHLANMRKALAISGTLTPVYNAWAGYIRHDSPYGTLSSESLYTGGSEIPVGQSVASSIYYRYRYMIAFKIPEWLSDAGMISTAVYTRRMYRKYGSPVLNLYSSNTDDVPYGTSDAYNTDNLEATFDLSSFTSGVVYNVDINVNVSASLIVAMCNSNLNYILATLGDVNSVYANEYIETGATTTAPSVLTITLA